MAVFNVIATADSPTAGVFDFPSLSLGSYRHLEIVLAGVTVTSNNTRIQLTYYIGGSEITGTAYRYAHELNTQDSAAANQQGAISQAAGFLQISTAGYTSIDTAARAFNALIRIEEPLSTAHHKLARVRAPFGSSSNSLVGSIGAFICENTGAVQGVKIQGSSAFTAGQCRVLAVA